MSHSPILPGATIGILGGGQLGRMGAMAAASLGYKVHIFCPEEGSPAAQVAHAATVAAYEDTEALRRFGQQVDVVTFEFENIPAEGVRALEATVPVRPSWEVLHTCRHRLREKQFINGCGIGTARFRKVANVQELENAVKELGLPAILKTCELGYDGKGQVKLAPGADLAAAWSALGGVECVLEGFVDFSKEISVIVARGLDGAAATYAPVENTHKNHILDITRAPADIPAATAAEAEKIAVTLAENIRLVGLLAVEMFVTKTDDLLVNELAPRPHNSGHYTLDACVTSQFEQHIRAVCGLPLGSTEQLCPAEMRNLIGDDILAAGALLREPAAKLHLYGKDSPRPGRKMGHLTRLFPKR